MISAATSKLEESGSARADINSNYNIALIGCGAIAESFYLPALAKRRHEFNRLWVVDPNITARQVACSIVEARQSATLGDISDDLRYVIVAAPNVHHFSIAREALLRSAHVLIEKPFVIWPNEGRELIKLAAARRLIIAVNQTRRLCPHSTELRRRIAAGDFGKLEAIVHSEGTKLTWPFSSGAAFAKGAERTGAIMDIGVHVLDFYQYLFEPTWAFESATHDGFKGSEGLTDLHLRVNDAPASVRLSRYQKLENAAHLFFENAEVRVSPWDPGAYFVKKRSDSKAARIVIDSATIDLAIYGDRFLANFVAAGEGREKAICDAESSLPVIEILDEIYRRAKRYPDTPGAV